MSQGQLVWSSKQVLGDAEEKQFCEQGKEGKTITTKNGGNNDFPFTKITYLIQNLELNIHWPESALTHPDTILTSITFRMHVPYKFSLFNPIDRLPPWSWLLFSALSSCLSILNLTLILHFHYQTASTVTVLDSASWPSARNLGLDNSQFKALQLALTNEFALIQGPPGTGKTYIGLKVIGRVLLSNGILMCQENSSLITKPQKWTRTYSYRNYKEHVSCFKFVAETLYCKGYIHKITR